MSRRAAQGRCGAGRLAERGRARRIARGGGRVQGCSGGDLGGVGVEGLEVIEERRHALAEGGLDKLAKGSAEPAFGEEVERLAPQR